MSGISTLRSIKNNFIATVNPTSSDDLTADYAVGSRWVNIVSKQEFTCRDNITGNAIWVVTGNSWSVEYIDNTNYVVTTQDAGKLLVVTTDTLSSIVTLPSIAAVKDGFTVVIAKDDPANTVTVNTSGGNNIRRSGTNVTTIVMSSLGDSIYLVKQANAWTLLDDKSLMSDHINDLTNPHEISKSQILLGNVQNYATASQTDAETGVLDTRYMTPLKTAQAIAALSPDEIDSVSLTANGYLKLVNGLILQWGYKNTGNMAYDGFVTFYHFSKTTNVTLPIPYPIAGLITLATPAPPANNYGSTVKVNSTSKTSFSIYQSTITYQPATKQFGFNWVSIGY